MYLFNPHPRTFFSLFVCWKRGRERETLMWERNINGPPPLAHRRVGRTCNLGTCPDPEFNLPPFGLEDDTQPTDPHQPGSFLLVFKEEGSFPFHEFSWISPLQEWTPPCYLQFVSIHISLLFGFKIQGWTKVSLQLWVCKTEFIPVLFINCCIIYLHYNCKADGGLKCWKIFSFR